MQPPIHWHEGLFLQPHHLQRMQKGLADQLRDDRKLAWPYPYGLVEARVSADDLENMRVRFERLRAVMPSGVEVDFPANAELPPLDIKRAFSKGSGTFVVSLAVPLWSDARANTVDVSPQADTRVKLLYRVSEIKECPDENTGQTPRDLQVRKLNARLLLEGEDPTDLEVLPLLRIKRATGEEVGRPRVDPDFVPPCLLLSGSPTLRELVRDLVAQVEASRKELVTQLTRGGFSLENLRGLQFEQLMRLRTLNRYSGRLPSQAMAPAATPFELYLGFRELLGELTALHPDRDDFESAAYDHDNPYIVFRELADKIRRHLRGVVAATYLKVPFQVVNGVMTAQLTEEHFTAPNAYLLGVQTKCDPMALARLVEDGNRFKLMPPTLGRSAIFGIALKSQRNPPLELPASADIQYFNLDRAGSEKRWEQIRNEKAMVLVWRLEGEDISDAKFVLYMTQPH